MRLLLLPAHHVRKHAAQHIAQPATHLGLRLRQAALGCHAINDRGQKLRQNAGHGAARTGAAAKLLRQPHQFIAAKGLCQPIRRHGHILATTDPAFHFPAQAALLQLAHQGSEAISRTATHNRPQQIAQPAARALTPWIAHHVLPAIRLINVKHF